MNYNILERYCSKARMDKYLLACKDSKEIALGRYKQNILVCQAFYPILNLFETFIRNAIYYQISLHFKDKDWINNQVTGFMSSAELKSSSYFLKKSILKCQKDMLRKKIKPSSDKIIAELAFGFWLSLFQTHHYKLVKGCPIHILPFKPKHVNRSEIWLKLDRIRRFRNRIYHNEPICFKKSEIDFMDTLTIRQDIYQCLKWMNPTLESYVKEYDEIIKRCNNDDN